MTISLIVAVSNNGIIGKNNALLWRLSDDLAFFKKLTTNNTIIMGRKTYESIGKPLPKRKNIVLTRQFNVDIPGCEIAHDIEEAINISEGTPFIIGGGEIYKLALPFVSIIYKTKVYCNIDGDVYFPELNMSEWNSTTIFSKEKDDKNEFSFDIDILQRVKYNSDIVI